MPSVGATDRTKTVCSASTTVKRSGSRAILSAAAFAAAAAASATSVADAASVVAATAATIAVSALSAPAYADAAAASAVSRAATSVARISLLGVRLISSAVASWCHRIRKSPSVPGVKK
ncbi:MAG: hypothetical protein EPO45_19185 [Sphingobium sp.]|nr:MAG: hypothetical protein EPO45_19185 [Sphingobium sp.]